MWTDTIGLDGFRFETGSQAIDLTCTRTDRVHTGSSGSSLSAARPLTSSRVVPGTSSSRTMDTHANMRLSVASAGHSIFSRF